MLGRPTAAKPGDAEPAHRKPGEPPEPSPLESSLQVPTVRSLPEPEQARTPPAAPRLGAVPAVRPAPEAPALMATAVPAPPPPVPVIAPPPPPNLAGRPEPKRTVPPVTVAALDLPGAATPLGPAERARLDQVVARYREKPGTVRVVSYAAPAAGGPEQLTSYRAALERAQVVVKVLVQGGIPANKIQSEAATAAGAAAPGHIEVQLAP